MDEPSTECYVTYIRSDPVAASSSCFNFCFILIVTVFMVLYWDSEELFCKSMMCTVKFSMTNKNWRCNIWLKKNNNYTFYVGMESRCRTNRPVNLLERGLTFYNSLKHQSDFTAILWGRQPSPWGFERISPVCSLKGPDDTQLPFVSWGWWLSRRYCISALQYGNMRCLLLFRN